MQHLSFPQNQKPYEFVGAGPVVSALWKRKHADLQIDGEDGDWRYRFNLFRMDHSGQVSRMFRPADIPDLVKLCQVLAAVLSDDGCLPRKERDALTELAHQLDQVTATKNEGI